MTDLTAIAARKTAVADATRRLIDAIGRADLDPRRPTLLPDWTVGHLLTHLARNADGQQNLLRWAASGEPTPMYPGDRRNADIEAGAGRPLDELVRDVRWSAARLAATLDAQPASSWDAVIDTGRGGDVGADVVLSQRLSEVELHHHDLGVDGGLADLDPAAGAALLMAVLHTYGRTRGLGGLLLVPDGGSPIPVGVQDDPTRIAGQPAAIVGWLSGRTDGADLWCDGPLPDLPSW